MAEKAQPQRHWPTPDILKRAKFVDDAGPIRFVDTEAATPSTGLIDRSGLGYRGLRWASLAATTFPESISATWL